MFRFAVIGYGFIGRRHVDTLKNHPDSDCIAVCDRNERRLTEVKELYPDMAVYLTADEMFAAEQLDGVIISANNNQHKDLVIKAARAGVDIIVEKPAAMSVADFDEMVAEVEKAGVKFTVHQQRRFDKDFNVVKECYEKGLVGDIYTIQSSLYGYNGNMHDWHVYKSEEIGRAHV